MIKSKKGEHLTAVEVKSGRMKNVGGSLVFKKLYPGALSLIVGGVNAPPETFLSGEVALFS